MSSRKVVENANGIIVTKSIPFFSELEGKQFPTIQNIIEDNFTANTQIMQALKNTTFLCQSAVIQQYNELYIWYKEEQFHDFLAPIIDLDYDERGLPCIIMPKFMPAAEDVDFYRYSDEEVFILWGRFSERCGLSYEQLKKFMNGIDELCDWYGLRRDDMIYNLSNIGFNSMYGMRVIDYGLANNDEGYELIF